MSEDKKITFGEVIFLSNLLNFLMVHEMRIELTRVAPYAPQTYASTNSATRAVPCYSSKIMNNFNVLFKN